MEIKKKKTRTFPGKNRRKKKNKFLPTRQHYNQVQNED